MKVAGRTAVVTGGASGLGLAAAAALVGAGALVAIIDLPTTHGPEAAASLGPSARFLPADVTSEEDLGEAIAAAGEGLGGLDIAVSCAGVATAGRILNREGAPLPLA